MDIVILTLLIASALVFAFAAFGIVAGRINLIALGLLLFVLVPLIRHIDHLA